MSLRKHTRIIRLAETLGVALHWDNEIGRFTYTPKELEAILGMAVMAGQNPFAQPEEDDPEPPGWVCKADLEEIDNVLDFRKGRTRDSAS